MDIIQSVDEGDVACLMLLDLSATFDTVNHSILLRRLHTSFGFRGPVLEWLRSYLWGRVQTVRRGRIDVTCQPQKSSSAEYRSIWTDLVRFPYR